MGKIYAVLTLFNKPMKSGRYNAIITISANVRTAPMIMPTSAQDLSRSPNSFARINPIAELMSPAIGRNIDSIKPNIARTLECTPVLCGVGELYAAGCTCVGCVGGTVVCCV